MDRSLGHQFARGLQLSGFTATHLDDLMPRPDGQSVADIEWIQWVGEMGWIALCVNPTMHRTPHEIAAIQQHGARVFSLASAQVAKEMKHFIIGVNWARIVRRSQRLDPCFWRVYVEGPPRKRIA